MSEILGLDHVQLAMPAGQEGRARDPDFHPAGKAHAALLVRGLADLVARCQADGFPAVSDEPLEGFDRVYVRDPFGNRIELLEQRENTF